MATNPMQRKARNSFLLGMLLMLVISSAIIGILLVMFINQKKAEEADPKVDVYTLNQNVSSGQIVTTDMLELKSINKSMIPSNATSNIDIIRKYALQDKEGNDLYTKYKNDIPTLYVKKDNTEYEVKKEEETENYYITKNNEKQYLELNSIPLIAKVTMRKNTIMTTELISKSDNIVKDDVRRQEYNMLVLPTDLTTGDYVDIRLMMPAGQDFIVISKKEVKIPEIDGKESVDTIIVDLTEDEILTMSNAIVDAYTVTGSKLYVTKYTEAGMQSASIPTYPVNAATSQLIRNDPNIVEKAMNALIQRYNATGASTLRNDYINSAISNAGDEGKTKLETKMEESITNSRSSRKDYLDSL